MLRRRARLDAQAIERAKASIRQHGRRFVTRFFAVIGALLVIKGAGSAAELTSPDPPRLTVISSIAACSGSQQAVAYSARSLIVFLRSR